MAVRYNMSCAEVQLETETHHKLQTRFRGAAALIFMPPFGHENIDTAKDLKDKVTARHVTLLRVEGGKKCCLHFPNLFC